ncbi:hypothetical protein [Ideonella sp. YS5]|uniref:hypothetical protein n=1 Tax=Ideonella sp. YS5 TaxID=3453714 RepID=UPI003EEDD650
MHIVHLASAACLAACAMVSAQARLPLFDDFSGHELDRTKWQETEAWRSVDKGKARLGRWIYGSSATDTGTTMESFILSTTTGSAPRSIAASITVTDIATNEGCAFNPMPSRPRARLAVAYFNVRPGGPVPGDRTGDVLGLIQLARTSNTADAPGILRVNGIVAQCLTADCMSASTLYLADLGTVSAGTKVMGRIDWEPAAKLFRFTRDKTLAIETPYTEIDTVPPSQPLQALGLRVEAANCASGPRTKAGIAAEFDNVLLAP